MPEWRDLLLAEGSEDRDRVVAGGVQNQSFQLSFNASLNIDFQGSRLTSNGGRLLLRELDERLGFGDGVAPRRLTVLEFRSWILD